MINKELIKKEVDKVQDEYLAALYEIIKVFEVPLKGKVVNEDLNWHDFIESTSGCLKNDPIERGEQGKFEIRERME